MTGRLTDELIFSKILIWYERWRQKTCHFVDVTRDATNVTVFRTLRAQESIFQ